MSNVNSPIPLCNVAIKPSAIREGIRKIDLNSHENIDLKTVLKSHESIREVEGKEAWNSCWRSEGVDVQRLKKEVDLHVLLASCTEIMISYSF